MALRLVQVNLKARDDVALGRFWAAALGWTASTQGRGATSVAPAGFVWTEPDAPVCVDVIAVPDPASVRYRAHLDLATTSAAQHAEVLARLRELGATPAEAARGGAPWPVLADPEGNVFCVREPRHTHRDTGPFAAVVVDCADPPAMARFWGAALGWRPQDSTEDHARLRPDRGTGPCLEFLRTPHLVGTDHRAHLDLVPYHGSGQAAEVARLRGLGATPADVGQGDAPWVVLADPEGNEFCVLAPD